ncbi:MAG: hypothetical protein ACT4P9_02010 [Betaproteobacteria bacterium]
MGLFDVFKKLVPKSEPVPWDPQEIRHSDFTLRLPEGWQFTEADWLEARASGPSGQVVEFRFAFQAQPNLTPESGPKLLKLMRLLVQHDAGLNAEPKQATLPNGVLWTEASEAKGAEHHFVVYVLKLREKRTAQIFLRTIYPASGGGFVAERLEALRGALRAVQWT